MEVYSLQPQPFLTNPSIPALFFRGVSTSNLPVVAKRYLCSALNHTTTISNVNTRIHEALFLAKIDHEHICKLLTAQFDIQSEAFSVTHIVEAADTDLRKEIDTRKRESRPFSEIELRQFLSQMAETLLFLHKKVTFRQGIAHRNLCPENILTDSAGSSYKLTGFSGHWEAAMPSTFQNVLEPGSHTCPELRQAFLGLKSNYNPFKSDVFALGATVLHMVNLTEPTELRSIGNLDAIVGGLLANIDCSEGLKALLSRMVTARDDSRILMHEVVEALAGLPQVRTGTAKSRSRKSKAKAAKSEQKQTNKPVQSSADVLRLPHVSDEEIRFFDEKRSDWGSAISLERAISCNLGSRYSLIDDDRIVTVGATQTVRATQTVSLNIVGTANHRAIKYSSTGETLPLSDLSRWTPIRGIMRSPRYNFTPCLHNEVVYLCGGQKGTTVDVFSLQTSRFEAGPALPIPPDDASLAVIDDGKLVVIFSDIAIRMELDGTQRYEVEQHESLYVGSNSTPVMVTRCVFVTQDPGCVKGRLDRKPIELQGFEI